MPPMDPAALKKAQTEAARALAYCAASHSDLAHHADDETVRRLSLIHI